MTALHGRWLLLGFCEAKCRFFNNVIECKQGEIKDARRQRQ